MTAEPNAPLLLKTLEHIENHPEEWSQEVWSCGTAGCFAFHAAVLDGAEAVAYDETGTCVVERPSDPDDAFREYSMPSGTIHVADRAQSVLNLSTWQAARLFAGSNTLDDLRAEVYRLVGDWSKLADLAITAATNSVNDERIGPGPYADPLLDLDEVHKLWGELKHALLSLQDAEDPTTVLDREVTGPDHDPETFVNLLRGHVDDAVHKLIGRRP